MSDATELLTAVCEWADDTDRVLDEHKLDTDASLLLADVRKAKKSLGDLERALVQHLGARLGHGTTDVPDVGRVVVHGSPKRKEWDHEKLLDDVIRLIADEPAVLFDPSTGEQRPAADVPAVTIRRLREVASFTWLADKKKQTGLWSLGLDPDDYAKTDYSYSVTLPAAS